ncbi:MAG: hypothetical protein RL220_258, partial [Bacteroidota bacterium]
MANLKEIRVRITSVNSTKQITSAMKMVSAAKLRRAQDAITRMRPYANKLQEILSNVSSALDGNEGIYSKEREVKNVLVVAITSNRGLCGAFNNNIVKETRNIIRQQSAKTNVKVLSLGKKAFDLYKRSEYHTTIGISETPYTVLDNLTFEKASHAAETIMAQFAEGKWDRVYVVYNQFKNAAVQIVRNEQFLPVVKPAGAAKAKTDYIFEPQR